MESLSGNWDSFFWRRVDRDSCRTVESFCGRTVESWGGVSERRFVDWNSLTSVHASSWGLVIGSSELLRGVEVFWEG